MQGVLQDAGYYKATAKVEARLVEADQRRRSYALTLHIEEEWQYLLGDVHFEAASHGETLAFPTNELRNLIPLERGEIFATEKIRQGMKAIEKLYDTKGYIDIVMTPMTDDDGDGDPIDLIMHIEEGKQYRFGKIEFLGLDPKTQARLRPQLESGELFNRNLVNELFKRNKTLLPADASWEDVDVIRNQGDGVVDLRFDFYTCPKLGKRTTFYMLRVD